VSRTRFLRWKNRLSWRINNALLLAGNPVIPLRCRYKRLISFASGFYKLWFPMRAIWRIVYVASSHFMERIIIMSSFKSIFSAVAARFQNAIYASSFFLALVFFPYASAQAQQLISTFIGQTVPSPMVAGQTYQVSVTMRNDGSETWSESTYHRLGSQNPQDNFIWGTNRAFLQGNASPGQQATFTFTVTAPNSVGTYNFQWRMVKEAVAWFGANSANAAVQVTSVTPPVAGNLIVNGGFEQTSVTSSSWASLYGAPCGWFDVGINTVGWSFSDSGSTGRGGIQRNTSCWGTTAPEGQ
jgi:Ig-like domain from next to BRCA1 gene